MLAAERSAKSARGELGKSFKSNKLVSTKFIPPSHPAIVITCSFAAPHIDRLKKKLEENFIPYGMQTSKKKLNRLPGAPTDKNFIIVDDSQGPAILQGEFLGLKMQRVDYPVKNNLDDVIKKFDKYIGLGKQLVEENQFFEEAGYQDWEEEQRKQRLFKLANKQNELEKEGIARRVDIQNEFENAQENVLDIKDGFEDLKDIFKSKSKQKYQGPSTKKENSNKISNITLKGVRKYEENQANIRIEKRILFMLITQRESSRYMSYVAQFNNSKNKRIILIRSIEEYFRYCYQNGEGQNCLLLSPGVAFKKLYKFRNLTDVYIYGDDPEFCAQLVKGNIKKAALDPNELDEILIEEGFDRNEPKQFIQPMRRLALNRKGPQQCGEEKEKNQKPSLFGRFIGLIKGKSSPKAKDLSKSKPLDQQKNSKDNRKKGMPSLKYAQKSSSESKSSSMSESQSHEKSTENKKPLLDSHKQKYQDQASIGNIIDSKIEAPSSSVPTHQLQRKRREPIITITKIKSQSKLGQAKQNIQAQKPEPEQKRLKVNTPIEGKIEENQKKESDDPCHHFKLEKACDAKIEKKEDEKFSVKPALKKEQLNSFKKSRANRRCSQVKFNFEKPLGFKSGKNSKQGSISSSPPPFSVASSDNQMVVGSKNVPPKKNQNVNKLGQQLARRHEGQSQQDVYFSSKPFQKKEVKNKQQKQSEEVHQIEDHYQTRKYQPINKMGNKKVVKRNNMKIEPEFCEGKQQDRNQQSKDEQTPRIKRMPLLQTFPHSSKHPNEQEVKSVSFPATLPGFYQQFPVSQSPNFEPSRPKVLLGGNPSKMEFEKGNRSVSTTEPRIFNIPFDESKYHRFVENGVVVYQPKHIFTPTLQTPRPYPFSNRPPLQNLQGDRNSGSVPVWDENSRRTKAISFDRNPYKVDPISTSYGSDQPFKRTGSINTQPAGKHPHFSTSEYFIDKCAPSPKNLPLGFILNKEPPSKANSSPPDKLHQVNQKPTCSCLHDQPTKQKMEKPVIGKNKENEDLCSKCRRASHAHKRIKKSKRIYETLDSETSSFKEDSQKRNHYKRSKSLGKPTDPLSSIVDLGSPRTLNPNKSYSVLYLVHSRLDPKIIKQLFQLSDQSDTIQTYSQHQKMVDIIQKGQDVFDYILVFHNNQKQQVFQQVNQVPGLIIVEYHPDALQSYAKDRVIFLSKMADLPSILVTIAAKTATSNRDSRTIKYIYFKDFNQPIRTLAKILKNQYPQAQVRRYFGLLDLPTKLPASQDHITIVLLDQVSFHQISAYCAQQEKQEANIVKICIPKSAQALKLCQKCPTRQKIIWLTQREVNNSEFIMKRISKILQ